MQEPSGPVSGRTQPSRPLPGSRFQTRSRSSPDSRGHTAGVIQPGSYCAKPALRLVWFWLTVCVRFWPNGSDLKASLHRGSFIQKTYLVLFRRLILFYSEDLSCFIQKTYLVLFRRLTLFYSEDLSQTDLICFG